MKDTNTAVLVNDQIDVSHVRVVAEGDQLGIMRTNDALREARRQSLDLVLVAPNANPPVAKIIDWGKHQYEASKRAKAAKAKQTKIEVKEIQLRPVTDNHDLDVKMKRARKFLSEGKKVRFHMKFRGREASHAEIGMEMMKDILESLDDIQIEKHPVLNGMNIVMVVAPESASKKT